MENMHTGVRLLRVNYRELTSIGLSSSNLDILTFPKTHLFRTFLINSCRKCVFNLQLYSMTPPHFSQCCANWS